MRRRTSPQAQISGMENMREAIPEKVKRYIEKHNMLERGAKVVVGVSGGADSVCLLHLLWRLSAAYELTLQAVHINHGVRKDAAADAAYVESLCDRLGVPFFLREVDMEGYAREMHFSPEEAGRHLRYQCFRETAARLGGDVKIAVAHNAEDRAETMLFHMFRGSGLKGMCSIAPVREEVIRPILCLTRTEIEGYLEEQGLSYCVDSTNGEDHYARNRIRHHILPYAEKEICTAAVPHMNELADMLSEAEKYLEEQTDDAFVRCVAREEQALCVDLARLGKEPEILQKRILRKMLWELTPHGKDITRQHIEDLLSLKEREGSKELLLPYELRARKVYDRLYLEKLFPREEAEPREEDFSFEVIDREAFFSERKENISENRYTKCFDYDKITTSLLLRTRQPGDYLTIDTALHKKTLKEYMINEKIPKWKRSRMLVLADGAHIVWVPGYRISQYYKVDENTRRILKVCLRGGENGRTD